MTVTFTKMYQVIRNAGGTYVDGAWVPSVGSNTTIFANVQPPGLEDYQRVASMPEGQSNKGLLNVLTDAVLTMGDVLVVDGEHWTVIGRVRRDLFGSLSETSHWKYLMTRQIEEG